MESRLGALETGVASVAGETRRVDDRLAGIETRMTNGETAARRVSNEVARMRASVRQIEGAVAREATRQAASTGAISEPSGPAPTVVRRPPASPSSAPSASPTTEPPRPLPSARVMPDTRGPGVPPTPTIALPPPALPPPARPGERVAPPSTPRSEQDLKTKMREDWETVKRDARNTGNEIKEAFRKFRDWVTP